jgi:Niemann-Pick C1 protein
VAFSTGESLTILKREVGGDTSWWKGMNQRGQVGLLPSSAVSMRPQPAPIIPQQLHVPEDANRRKSMTLNRSATLAAPGTIRYADEDDVLHRRGTANAPPVPQTLKPIDADRYDSMSFAPPVPVSPPLSPRYEPAQPSHAPGTLRTLRPVSVAYEPSNDDYDAQQPTDSVRLRPVSTYYPERPLEYRTAGERPTTNMYPERPAEYRTARERPEQDEEPDYNRDYRTARRSIKIEDMDDDGEELDFTGKRRTIKKDPEPEPYVPPAPKTPNPTRASPRRNDDDDDASWYESYGHGCESMFSQLCYGVGRFDSMCGACVIIVVLVVVAALCVGSLRFAPEARPDALWALPDSTALEHRNFIAARFAAPPRENSIIVQTPGPIPSTNSSTYDDDEDVRRELANADNVLTTTYLLDALTLHQRIMALEVSETDDASNGNRSDAGTFAFPNLCQRGADGSCRFASPLAAWHYDRTLLANDPDPIATLNAALPDDDIEALLGGIERETINGSERIVSARAMHLKYWLANRERTDDNDNDNDNDDRPLDPAAERWEDGVLNETRFDKGQRFAELQVFPNMQRSLYDQYFELLLGDGMSLGISIGLVTLYTLLLLGNQPFVYSRGMLAVFGVFASVCSIGVMTGVASALELVYGPLQTVLPFILLAMGVDALFLLVASFDETDWSDTTNSRGGQMMAIAGLPLTFNALTMLATFACGAITFVPAVREFCLWALIGVTALFLLQLTLFAALAVCDGRRQKGERLDCGLCCFKSCCGCCEGERPDPKADMKRDGNCLRYPLWFYIAKVVAHPLTAVIVIVISIAGACVGAYGASLLVPSFAVDRYTTTESYALNYTRASTAYFTSGPQLAIVARNIDHYAHRATLRDVSAAVEANAYVDGNVTGWLPAFEAALGAGRWGGAAAATRSDWWHGNLSRFLRGAEGLPYAADVNFEGSVTRVAASRLWTRLRAQNSSSDRADQMTSVRADVDAVVADASLGDGDVFAFAQDFVYLEHVHTLGDEGIQNIGIAVACVVVLTLLMLPHIASSLTVVVSIFFTLGDVLGVLYLADTEFDAVVTVVIIFSIGIATHYAALVGHAFIIARGERNERVREAVQRTGPVVMHGAVTMLAAIVVLAFRPSMVFRTFFKIISTFLLFGVWQAVFFVPAVLTLIGPSTSIKERPVFDNED